MSSSSPPKTQSGSGGPLTHLFNGYLDYFLLGGGAKRPDRDVDLSPPPSAGLRMIGAIPLLSLYAFMACKGTNVYFQSALPVSGPKFETHDRNPPTAVDNPSVTV